jgi:flagellin
MTSINTNTASTIAANALYKNERKMGVAMERLSTGLRINSAKDDAAGLAIAKKMGAQISGLRQASRNANDGIAMLQTFEGASGEITSMLNRMRDLLIQAQNGTYTEADRANLGEEYNSLKSEIERTISDTQWNTRNLMKGSNGVGNTVSLMIGANAGQTMDVALNDWYDSVSSNVTIGGGATRTNDANADGTPDQEEIQNFNLTAVNVAVGDSIVITFQDKEYVWKNETSAAKTGATLVTELTRNTSATSQVGVMTAAASGTAGHIQYQSGGTNDFTDYENMVMVHVKSNVGVKVQSWDKASITEIDRAITNATSERSKYGAYISRLEKTSDNLLNVALNTDASRGQIEDADYAAETTELARTQIIAQAGTAMLAQANQVKQTVLALLK